MKTDQLSETRIIEAVHRGDKNALDNIYVTNQQEFITWATTNFKLSKEVSKDIYQDAFVILFENIANGKFESKLSSIKTYVYGIGKNLIYTQLRNEKKTAKHEVDLYQTNDDGLDDGIVTEKLIEAIESALDKLEEKCRTILTSFYFYKLNLKAIAEVMNYKSEDVVKNQKVRCLKYLKKTVNEILEKIDS